MIREVLFLRQNRTILDCKRENVLSPGKDNATVKYKYEYYNI